MKHFQLYHPSLPSFLRDFTQTPAVQRLKRIGMNCGCEYTAFPLFEGLDPYSRYDHSIGVALIVWNFTHSIPQAISGLLHDVATPVFAHVVDFLNGDYLNQDSTEAETEKMISASPDLLELLRRYDLRTQDVCNYHLYPVADNKSPGLSADRLEYSLGNMLNYGFCSRDAVKQYYGDLCVGTNEIGQDELMFRTAGTAEAFAMNTLKCSEVYVSDEDRYAMQILSEILRAALTRGVLEAKDLYTTEPEVINKLRQDRLLAGEWREYRQLKRIIRADRRSDSGKWRQVDAKKRWIDPTVQGLGRLSQLSPDFNTALRSFLNTKLDTWICGSGE